MNRLHAAETSNAHNHRMTFNQKTCMKIRKKEVLVNHCSHVAVTGMSSFKLSHPYGL